MDRESVRRVQRTWIPPVVVELTVAAAVLLGASGSARARPQDERANPEALVLKDFKERIERYMKLHDRLEDKVPPLEETRDPAKITASQKALSEKIRDARRGARQGDIFTPRSRRCSGGCCSQP
jgi:hypothetical protein